MKKYSKQREEIKKAVKENRIHPTAEEVFEIVRGQHSSASLSTVYRNLNLLSEEGIIKKIPMPNGSFRFDSTMTPHHHIICKYCSRVFDIEYPIEALETAVFTQTGVKMTDCQVIMEGICEKCQVDVAKIQ